MKSFNNPDLLNTFLELVTNDLGSFFPVEGPDCLPFFEIAGAALPHDFLVPPSLQKITGLH
jgi:hypothetical protein